MDLDRKNATLTKLFMRKPTRKTADNRQYSAWQQETPDELVFKVLKVSLQPNYIR
jgi:hypothetical protein